MTWRRDDPSATSSGPTGQAWRRGEKEHAELLELYVEQQGGLKTNPIVAWYGSHRNGDLFFFEAKADG